MSLTMVGDVKIPLIGLGTLQTNDEELENALSAALEIGYRHIDTATFYENEHIIGSVLNKWFNSGKLKREDIFVTTKLPMTHIHPDQVELCLKESLKKLQLEYVDLYLVHCPIHMKIVGPEKRWEGLPTDLLGVWTKMEEQVDAKRARTIGISNFSVHQIDRILNNARIKPANLQVELHIYLQQKELVQYCHQNNITIVGYFSLGSPGLKNFVRPESPFPKLLQLPTVLKIAQKHNRTAAQVLLRFWTQRNIVVIPKSVNPERLRENFNHLYFTLDLDDLNELEGLDKGEDGRLLRMDLLNPELKNHPEYPYEK